MAAEMIAKESRPKVQRLPIRRVQRRKPGNVLLKLGDSPRMEEMPAPVDVDRIVLNSLAGVADITRVQSMFDTVMSEVKHVHADNVSSSMVSQRTGPQVSLHDIDDVFYIVPVKLGTPYRTAHLILDTGSSDFWVDPRDGDDDGGTLYSTGASTSFHPDVTETYKILYGKGVVVGHVGVDSCCLQSFCIEEEKFIVADKVEDIGGEGYYEGLLGLAYPKLAQCTQCSLIHQVLKSHTYDSFAFSLFLAHKDKDSYVEFGEFDTLKSIAGDTFGDGVTVSIYGSSGQATYWMTKPEEIHVGEKIMKGAVYAVLDSGTSLLTVPEDHYNTIWPMLLREESKNRFPDAGCSDKLTGAKGMLVCICGKTKLNPLSFVYQDISGKKSMKITLGEDDLLQPFAKLNDGTEVCRPAFTKGPEGFPFWLLGDVFMRQVYTIHDVHHLKLHLYHSGVGSVHYDFTDSSIRGLARLGFISWFFFMVACCCVFTCRGCCKGGEAREDVYSQLLS